MSNNGTVEFDDLKTDLKARVDRGLKYGQSKGVDGLEIYIINTKSLSISLEEGMISATHGGQVGVGVRSVMGKKVGFASASGITDDSVNFAIESAFSLSKSLSDEDDRWKNFVTNDNSGKEGLIEDSVLEYTSEDAVKGANSIFKEARAFDQRIVSVTGNVNIGYGGFAIGNTEGLIKASRSTYGFGFANISVKAGDKTKEGFDFIMGRGVPNFEGVGTNGAKKAVKLLDSKPLGKTGEMNVLFDNISAGQAITTGLGNSINGMSVVEGRSAFADKIGDEVGVKSLNIFDDAQIKEDPGMAAVDAEGFPRSTTQIIKDGVLMSFIFDNY
ncbi:MAG: TldD/PmbA family protein, partial [Candidatus Kariarchaeaceae archaeon]